MIQGLSTPEMLIPPPYFSNEINDLGRFFHTLSAHIWNYLTCVTVISNKSGRHSPPRFTPLSDSNSVHTLKINS